MKSQNRWVYNMVTAFRTHQEVAPTASQVATSSPGQVPQECAVGCDNCQSQVDLLTSGALTVGVSYTAIRTAIDASADREKLRFAREGFGRGARGCIRILTDLAGPSYRKRSTERAGLRGCELALGGEAVVTRSRRDVQYQSAKVPSGQVAEHLPSVR